MIVWFGLADPCGTCRTGRFGEADMERRRFKIRLPDSCQDRARCDGEIEAILRGEIARCKGLASGAAT